MKSAWLALGAAIFVTPALAAQSNHNQRAQQNEMNQMPATQAEQMNDQGQYGQQGQTARQGQGSKTNRQIAQRLREDLQKSGFSNVTIMPETFIIHAQDRRGNPVVMVVNPESIAAVEVSKTGRSMAPRFVQGLIRDAMNANLADTQVKSIDHQNVGTIKGIGISENGQLSYVLTTERGRDVAVGPQAISLSYNDSNGTWDVTVDATKQRIESAPQIQWEQNTQQ